MEPVPRIRNCNFVLYRSLYVRVTQNPNTAIPRRLVGAVYRNVGLVGQADA